MMLQHMGLNEYATRIQKAAFDVLAEGKVCLRFLRLMKCLLTEAQAITGDLGGKAKTHEYAQAIISKL